MPTSDFEARPDYEFAFFLADRLGMTVDELSVRMTYREFLEWTVYHGRRGQEAQLARGG
jgi:hypothetical protein